MNWPGLAAVFEKNRETIDEQGLRNAVENRAEQRFEANFVGEGAAEFDQRAAIVEPIAIEEAIETGLHAIRAMARKRNAATTMAMTPPTGPVERPAMGQFADDGDDGEIDGDNGTAVAKCRQGRA